MSTPLLRDQVVARLQGDLIGPLSLDELLTDRPTQRYSTGILYPRDAQIAPEEDDDGGLEVTEQFFKFHSALPFLRRTAPNARGKVILSI